MKSGRVQIAIVGVVVAGVVGFFAFNQYIYNQKQADQEILPPFDGEIMGEYVCLPHRDTQGPQTMECAYGIRLDDGTHMALDFGPDPEDLAQFQVGERATLTGHFTPIQVISSDRWFKYDIKGIFSVKSK